MNKLVLIVNESKLYRDKLTKETYTKWGRSLSDIVYLNEWIKDVVSHKNLFNTPFAHLDLENENDIKKFKELVESDKKNKKIFHDNWFGHGTIITAPNSKSTNFLVKFVSSFNGETFIKEDLASIKKNIYKKLNLNKDIQIFIDNYVGENIDKFYIVSNSLEKLPNGEIENLTIEKLYNLLPTKPGEIPPWNLLNSIINSKIADVHYNLDRTLENTHPFLILALLRGKFGDWIRYKTLLLNGLNEPEICKILGYNSPYRLKDFKANKAVTLNTLHNAMDLLLILENDFRGFNRRLDMNNHFKYSIIKLSIGLKYNNLN